VPVNSHSLVKEVTDLSMCYVLQANKTKVQPVSGALA
jgi:hypothetical protein